jgi:hypothetical protein
MADKRCFPKTSTWIVAQTIDYIGLGGMFAVLLLCSILSPSVVAQVAGGTVSGSVIDPAGSAVPNAEVVILNPATGITRALTTNESGFFSVPNLIPAIYEVKVSSNGFTTLIEKVELKVGSEVQLNFQLKVGDVKEQVVIDADTTAIDQTSSTLNATVQEKTIRELPLNGRDWTQLGTLEPGVHTIEAQTAISTGSNGRANRGWGTQMSIGGNRPQQNVYRLDGIIINDYAGSGPGSVLGSVSGVDAIQEFSVVTGNASADYGRTSGGVINAVTRSGQNQVHGSAYEFLRNSALDARNFFDGATVPPFKRNQFGASVGGPIYLPRFGEGGPAIGYNGKNRTFFFFDYEGLRQDLGSTTLNTVPSRAARTGQLTSGKVTIDPKIIPFLNLFPLPNSGENGDTGFFSFASQAITTSNFFTGRIDHKFSEKNSAHATFLVDNSETTGPDSFNFVLIGGKSQRRHVSIEDTYILSPSLINIARVGYNRSVSLAPISVNPIDQRAADTSLGFLPSRAVGGISISGITTFIGGLGSIAEADYHYNSYQFYDDVVYTHKDHSFKFGVTAERIQSNEFSVTDASGRFTFGSLQSFLTNRPTSFNASIPSAAPTIYLRQTVFGAYAQDDYRVRPNLTLNLGVRYEMATVPTEKFNHLSNLASLTAAQPQVGSPYFKNPTLLNFAPRVGFSWDPFKDGKTAIRGGFGIYDTLPLTYQFELLVVNDAPIFQSGAVTTLAQGSFPTAAFASLTGNDLRYAYIQPDPKRSYVEQWNLNIQRQLPAGIVLQAGYIGQHGVHQPFRTTDANIVLPTMTAQGLVWPTPRATGTRLNTKVGTINALAWLSTNSYNAMNLRISRDHKGIRVGFAYTWSKSIDTSSSSITGANFNNSIVGPFLFFPQLMRGLSDFDVRHNAVFNYLWEIPHPGFAKGFAKSLSDGWQLGGIFRIASGLPFTPTIGGDPLGLRNSATLGFPDRVDSPACANPVNPGDPIHYIKTECFVVPQPGTRLGNSGRNIAIGPGIRTFDLSIVKNTHFGDRFNLQFRTEVFNAFNHTNFAVPDRTSSQLFTQTLLPIATAGRLNGTSTTSRQIQFGLKLLW